MLYFCGINEFSNQLSVIKTLQLTITKHTCFTMIEIFY